MKAESVLNALMYIFRHHIHSSGELVASTSQLFEKLEELGFSRQTVYQALDWMKNLNRDSRTEETNLLTTQGFRVYTAEELKVLGPECHSLLLNLEAWKILTPHTRELVINRVLELENEGIDLQLLKWVTLMVLFSQPDEQGALQCMELFVLGDATVSRAH